ncbi:MAG: transporter [Planctomycetaceae bacterium]|nr:transporter [Planctomycetaceae bacterium]
MLLHSKLIHPEINAILGKAGHHAKVLIADGNYPASTAIGPNAELISLNLAPGVVSCTQVLEALVSAVPIDIANTMGIPADDPYALQGDPPIWDEYRSIFQAADLDLQLEPIDKWDFYEAVASPEHVLTIQTADQALWANLLLSIGCRTA